MSAFDVVAAYKNREACEILAGFLRAALEDGEKAEHLDRALWAFSSATGKSFRGAGLFEPAAPSASRPKRPSSGGTTKAGGCSATKATAGPNSFGFIFLR